MKLTAQSVLASLLVTTLAAQTPVPAPAPILRTTTRLIQISLVAQDKHGNPITDLTKDDFVLTDAGKPQKISLFSLERAQKVSPSARPAPDPNVMVLSNHVEQATGAVTVILFDSLNTKFGDQAMARKNVIAYLKQASPSDRIALYTLGRNLKILHDFTSSTASMIRALSGHSTQAIDSVVADAEPADPNSGSDEMDDLMSWADGAMSDYVNVNRAELTLSVLTAIAQHVSRIPGRKNLVWISGGFPFSINQDEINIDHPRDSRNFDDQTRKMARLLNDANMAIYAIDARGVFAPDVPDASSAMGSSNSRQGRGGMPRAIRVDHTRETFDIVAERTGGKAFHNTNDIAGAIGKAVDDARVSYVIGYYPADATWDGKFHQVKLQCKRSGVQMRYRPGYFASGEAPHRSFTTVGDAITSNISSSDIGLTAALTLKPTTVDAAVTIQADNLTMEQQDGNWQGKVEFLAVEGNAAKGSFAGQPVVLNIKLPQADYEVALKEGLHANFTFTPGPDTDQFRIAVRDVATGTIGSLIINRKTPKK